MPVAEASLPTAQRSGFQGTRCICSFSYSRTRIMFQYVGYCCGWSMTKPRVRVPNSRLKKRASAHGGLAAAFMSSAHPIPLKQAQLRTTRTDQVPYPSAVRTRVRFSGHRKEMGLSVSLRKSTFPSACIFP